MNLKNKDPGIDTMNTENLDMNPKQYRENKTMTWEVFMESRRRLSKKRKLDFYSSSTIWHTDIALAGKDKVVIKRARQPLLTMD